MKGSDEPCTTWKDCWYQCRDAIPFCVNGKCNCGIQEDAINNAPVGTIRKFLQHN